MANPNRQREITIITFHDKNSQAIRPPLTITDGSPENLKEIDLPSGRILIPYHSNDGTTKLKIRGAPRGNADWYYSPTDPVIITAGKSGQIDDHRIFGSFKTIITATRL